MKRFMTALLLGLPLLFLTAQEKKVPDYSSTPRKDIPSEYTWNVQDLYPSIDAWKQDKDELVRLMSEIEKRRDGWTRSAGTILAMYELTDKISLKALRLGAYAHNLQDMDMGNAEYRALTGELQSIYTDYGVKLSFRNADILKADESALRGLIKQEPKLAPYKFRIEEILRSRSHELPEEQKKIVALNGLISDVPSNAADILNNVDMPNPQVTLSDGKTITLNYATFIRYRSTGNPADRRLIMQTFWANRKRFENTLAALYDGGMKQHLYDAKVQKFDEALSARLFEDNIDTTVYHHLVRDTRANLAPLHRYYRLKKELLGLDTMRYDDIFTSAVRSIEKEYSYDEGREMVLAAMKPLGQEYLAGLQKAFAERWIDRYPNKDKQIGAYSRGVYGVHPYVKMNFDGKYDNVSTLAHELGHAMHSYYANANQPYGLSGYPTFLAEIASTFNEHLLINYMLKNEKDDLFKLYLLDEYLEQMRGTLYHQVMFADFELAMHRRVESGQSLTTDWLNKTYLDGLRTYYGHDKGVMVVGEYFKNAWSSVPHFFRNYYVFQYSTGIIASMALSDQVMNGGKKESERFLTLLKSGGSDHPIALLKQAGVDMTTSAPSLAAFRRFDSLVGEMEKLVAKLKAEKKL